MHVRVVSNAVHRVQSLGHRSLFANPVLVAVQLVEIRRDHHHLGFNVWRGAGVPPAPPGTVGLREWTVVLSEDGLAELLGRLDAAAVPRDGALTTDPWGNAVRFVSAP